MFLVVLITFFQRGNRKAAVFHDDSDRLVYLRLLRDACDLHRTFVWTYTLMDNHIHIIGIPEREDSLAKTIREAHGEYSSYFNTKYALVGHVWQGRFKSVAMQENHCWNAIRYVERNPVRAGMARLAEEYLWSSAAAHCGLRDDPVLSGDCPLVTDIKNWSEWLKIENPNGFDDHIRLHTRTGKPLGSDEFVRRIESQTGRKLLPQKRGPHPKSEQTGINTDDSKDQPPTLFG